ncbi:hypothetical protein L915_17641 [Phytophthora nicotianae]|uniref:BED-type domain-containing protein n=1 Tax=Phytophthora nicotianae TaxID=4792 RepID=W2FYP2_PHYNI|nr:hypothetical protein L915_17641 [Phytophthora nicotianae]
MSDALVTTLRSPTKFSPKQITAFYFKPFLTEEGDPTGLQICKACGKMRKHAPKTGYTNLVSHVRSEHSRFEAEMEAASTAATGTLLPWVRQKVSNRHAWLLWLVCGNLPFSFVEMETTRRYTNFPPVCEETITRDMENVTKAVERRIGDELPENFGIVLDGWTHGSEHYLAVFACYELNGVRQAPLLSMAPIINGPDDSLNAESHMAALSAFLPFFGKTLSNVIFLVGDNCEVNKRLARLLVLPLVGCASHRLNLAVQSFIAPYEEELEQVQPLMKRLRTINQAAKLRLKTRIRPKLRQVTRWGSTYTMLSRYFELCGFISADDEELAEEMPSLAVKRKLKALLEQLGDVQSVSMKLQSDDLSLLDARDLLNGLLEVMPSFVNYLDPKAEIVHSPDFESGVVKVLRGQVNRLNRAEKSSLLPFVRRAPPPARVEDTAKVGFAERILKHRNPHGFQGGAHETKHVFI